MQLSEQILILGKDNPYTGVEDNLQKAIARALRFKHKDLLWYHVPNGGKRNIKEATKFKAMGVLAGVSDLHFDEARCGFFGLKIELKTKSKRGILGKPTQSQIEYLNKACDRGYLCAICYSIDAVLGLVDNYLKNYKL